MKFTSITALLFAALMLAAVSNGSGYELRRTGTAQRQAERSLNDEDEGKKHDAMALASGVEESLKESAKTITVESITSLESSDKMKLVGQCMQQIAGACAVMDFALKRLKSVNPRELEGHRFRDFMEGLQGVEAFLTEYFTKMENEEDHYTLATLCHHALEAGSKKISKIIP